MPENDWISIKNTSYQYGRNGIINPEYEALVKFPYLNLKIKYLKSDINNE